MTSSVLKVHVKGKEVFTGVDTLKSSYIPNQAFGLLFLSLLFDFWVYLSYEFMNEMHMDELCKILIM